jgi:hypothetical protein
MHLVALDKYFVGFEEIKTLQLYIYINFNGVCYFVYVIKSYI